MFSIKPKEDKFFELFISSAESIYESAKMLQDFVQDLSNPEEKLKQIKDMERLCDQKVHKTLEELNKTFITPFDREDIYDIAKEMDNIEDYIESAASRFVLFNVTEATDDCKELAKIIVDSTEELITVMKELKSMSKSKLLIEKIIDINRLEEDGDILQRKAIRTLFNSDMPAIEVIKWREIYERLEHTIDACENVANMVEGVAMKNA